LCFVNFVVLWYVDLSYLQGGGGGGAVLTFGDNEVWLWHWMYWKMCT